MTPRVRSEFRACADNSTAVPPVIEFQFNKSKHNMSQGPGTHDLFILMCAEVHTDMSQWETHRCEQ